MSRPAVLISQVGPRDGLQSVSRVMPTAAQRAWIDALFAARQLQPAGLPGEPIDGMRPEAGLPKAFSDSEGRLPANAGARS